MSLPPVDLSAVEPCLGCHGLGQVRIVGNLIPCPMCACFVAEAIAEGKGPEG